MDNMIKMLQALEQRVWKNHGKGMPNENLRQCATSFVVRYEFGIDDAIGSIFLSASSDSMCISVFRGKDPNCPVKIYSTPDIYQLSVAEKMLKKIEDIINDSTYEGYCSDIELIAKEIEKEYNT